MQVSSRAAADGNHAHRHATDPHIGHLHSSLLADVYGRYARLRNPLAPSPVVCTGTDEHGLKMQRVAEGRGMSPQELCDQVSPRFKVSSLEGLRTSAVANPSSRISPTLPTSTTASSSAPRSSGTRARSSMSGFASVSLSEGRLRADLLSRRRESSTPEASSTRTPTPVGTPSRTRPTTLELKSPRRPIRRPARPTSCAELWPSRLQPLTQVSRRPPSSRVRAWSGWKKRTTSFAYPLSASASSSGSHRLPAVSGGEVCLAIAS